MPPSPPPDDEPLEEKLAGCTLPPIGNRGEEANGTTGEMFVRCGLHFKPLNLKKVLHEGRKLSSVGAPQPPDPGRPRRYFGPLKELPPLSARAMAAVKAVRGDGSSLTTLQPKGKHRGILSARGVAGEAKIKVDVFSAASAESVDCGQLRDEVQELLNNVRSMRSKLAKTEHRCAEKAKETKKVRTAYNTEVSQIEAARTEVFKVRHRIETFKAILSKASRDTEDVSPRSLSSLRRRDDEALSKMSLAGAQGVNAMLLAEITRAPQAARQKLTSHNGQSVCATSDGDLDSTIQKLRIRLAEQRTENARMRSEIVAQRAKTFSFNFSTLPWDADSPQADRRPSALGPLLEVPSTSATIAYHASIQKVRGLAEAAKQVVDENPIMAASFATAAAAIAEENRNIKLASGMAVLALDAAKSGASQVASLVKGACDMAVGTVEEQILTPVAKPGKRNRALTDTRGHRFTGRMYMANDLAQAAAALSGRAPGAASGMVQGAADAAISAVKAALERSDPSSPSKPSSSSTRLKIAKELAHAAAGSAESNPYASAGLSAAAAAVATDAVSHIADLSTLERNRLAMCQELARAAAGAAQSNSDGAAAGLALAAAKAVSSAVSNMQQSISSRGASSERRLNIALELAKAAGSISASNPQGAAGLVVAAMGGATMVIDQ